MAGYANFIKYGMKTEGGSGGIAFCCRWGVLSGKIRSNFICQWMVGSLH